MKVLGPNGKVGEGQNIFRLTEIPFLLVDQEKVIVNICLGKKLNWLIGVVEQGTSPPIQNSLKSNWTRLGYIIF